MRFLKASLDSSNTLIISSLNSSVIYLKSASIESPLKFSRTSNISFFCSSIREIASSLLIKSRETFLFSSSILSIMLIFSLFKTFIASSCSLISSNIDFLKLINSFISLFLSLSMLFIASSEYKVPVSYFNLISSTSKAILSLSCNKLLANSSIKESLLANSSLKLEISFIMLSL